jgi:hypothetical protein
MTCGTNIPRGFEFLKGDNNKWWYEKGRSDREYASVYVDGGKKEDTKEAKDEFFLEAGSIIFIRPPIEHRNDKWMVNMEFHVVTDAADAITSAPTIAAVRSDLFLLLLHHRCCLWTTRRQLLK